MLLFKPGQNEFVDGIVGPAGVRDFWELGTRRRLEGPMFAWVFASGSCDSSFRPISALVDPGAKQPNLLVCQWVLLLRHAGDVIACSGDGLNDKAFGAFAGDQKGTGIPAFEGG